jgi:hypothetical protein
VTLLAFDDLVDVPRAGDRCVGTRARGTGANAQAAHGTSGRGGSVSYRMEVTGIYRATPVRVTPRNRAVHQLYRTYIDVVHFRQTDAKRLRVNRRDVGPDEYAAKYDAHQSVPTQCVRVGSSWGCGTQPGGWGPGHIRGRCHGTTDSRAVARPRHLRKAHPLLWYGLLLALCLRRH